MKRPNAYKIAMALSTDPAFARECDLPLSGVLDAPLIDMRTVTNEMAIEAHESAAERGEDEAWSPLSRLPWPAVTLHLGSTIIHVDTRSREEGGAGLIPADDTGAWAHYAAVSHLNANADDEDSVALVMTLFGGMQFVEVDETKVAYATAPYRCIVTSPFATKSFPIQGGGDETLNGLMHEIQASHIESLRDAMAVINAPHNNVVQAVATYKSKRAKRAEKRGEPIPFGERPRMIVIPRKDIVKRYKAAHGMTDAERMPHFRRGHLRTLTDDRFVHKKGQRVWVRPTKIGEPEIEWHEKALAYTVVS